MSDTAPNEGSVEWRLDRIEAILRDRGLHEPSCPQRDVEKANAYGGAYYMPRECECWLSAGDGDTP